MEKIQLNLVKTFQSMAYGMFVVTFLFCRNGVKIKITTYKYNYTFLVVNTNMHQVMR